MLVWERDLKVPNGSTVGFSITQNQAKFSTRSFLIKIKKLGCKWVDTVGCYFIMTSLLI